MELMMEDGIDGDFLLGDHGDFALDESCCCEGEICECACPLLDQASLMGKSLRVTVSGPISAVCRMDWHPASLDGLLCPYWEWDLGGSNDFCFSDPTGCQEAYQLNYMNLYCDNGTTLDKIVFGARLSNKGCDFVPGDADPRGSATTAWKPEVISCPDSGDTADFYAKYRFPIEGQLMGGGGCNCSTADFIFEVEII